MDHTSFLLILFAQISFLLTLCSSGSRAQQNYSGNSIMSCNNNDTMGPSPAFLYTCNGLHNSCLAFLIFKSQPPHNSTITISNLTSSNPQELAKINNATLLTVFPTGKEVIVPVNCSCSTPSSWDNYYYYYYQAETKYVLPPKPTYFTVANNTYQGLSTCDSLVRANPYGVLDLLPGMELHVPLRCACPTRHQATNNGTNTKYLLTYPVNWGDNISYIAERFHVTAGSLVEANGFSSENQTLYPFTTVLIPLPSEPTSSMTKIVHYDQPTTTTTSPPLKSKTRRKLLLVVAATTGSFFILVLCVILSVLFLLRRKRTERLIFKRGSKGNKTIPVSSEDIRGEIACIDDNLSRVYTFEEIKEATENFSSGNRIKGSVYRGVFGGDHDKDHILAIKKMKSDATKEVNLLGKINHFNLIKLKGYCKNHDNGSFCLVFEYMENGSLREWLNGNKSWSTTEEHQSWEKRVQIALDIANGLDYLHNFTEPCYVHKGISTDNILLNGDLRAKIANFSLAEESEREIMNVASKLDVYAFGVVLLELIAGKEDSSTMVPDGIREVMLDGKDDVEERFRLLIDPRLSTGDCGGKVVFGLELVRLSLACLMEEPSRRPNMAEVVSGLLKIFTDIRTKE